MKKAVYSLKEAMQLEKSIKDCAKRLFSYAYHDNAKRYGITIWTSSKDLTFLSLTPDSKSGMSWTVYGNKNNPHPMPGRVAANDWMLEDIMNDIAEQWHVKNIAVVSL